MVYNRMTKEEAEAAGISVHQARFYFRVDNDKANLAPIEATDWYRMNNEDLPNGDSVGVACSWAMPDLFHGITMDQIRSMQSMVGNGMWRSEEHTSELQSLMRISYAVFCLQKSTKQNPQQINKDTYSNT